MKFNLLQATVRGSVFAISLFACYVVSAIFSTDLTTVVAFAALWLACGWATE